MQKAGSSLLGHAARPEGWGAGSVGACGPTLILIQSEQAAQVPGGVSCPPGPVLSYPFSGLTQAEVSTNFTGTAGSQLEELTACLQTGCLQESSPSLVCRLPTAPPPPAGGILVGWGRQGVGETRLSSVRAVCQWLPELQRALA